MVEREGEWEEEKEEEVVVVVVMMETDEEEDENSFFLLQRHKHRQIKTAQENTNNNIQTVWQRLLFLTLNNQELM